MKLLINFSNVSLAQLVESYTFNVGVAGSSPAGDTK